MCYYVLQRVYFRDTLKLNLFLAVMVMLLHMSSLLESWGYSITAALSDG